jgi:uncharacterized protein (DUF697 family)
MAGIKDLSSIWTNIKDLDLKPYRDAALYQVKLALVGRPGSGRHTLADLLRRDPSRLDVQTQSPLALLPFEAAESASGADLIILLVDLTLGEVAAEQALAKRWNDSGKKLLVLGTHLDELAQSGDSSLWPHWPARQVLYGSLLDQHFIQRSLVPAILELLPGLHLALGRQFPLFRLTVAHQLINETCFSNTAYALSTGLAEIVPVLDIPLNVTDMIVLTKSQAFLVYKLGLALGFSTRWQDYLAEFGSVIGGGFLWRQLARSLVGLIPVWGIVPKVAVSYAGTYVVGNTVLQWYLTGRHLSPRQMRQLYQQAFARGKESARRMLAKVRRPRLSRSKPAEQLPQAVEGSPQEFALTTLPPQAEVGSQTDSVSALEAAAALEKAAAPEALAGSQLEPSRRGKKRPKPRKVRPPKRRICPVCNKMNAGDALFCQYCGTCFAEV